MSGSLGPREPREPFGLCSRASLEAGESMSGTAPVARSWLVIEQPGAYGRDALTQSYLPAEVARHVSSFVTDGPIRPLLVRRNPGRRHEESEPVSSRDRSGGRRVWWSGSGAELWSLPFEDARELLDLALAPLAAGRPDLVHPAANLVPEPMLLLCTNGARDRCCAVRTRPIATALLADPDRRDRVWECSHLGGHRFAPTAVQLPHGWVHGRLDPESAGRVLDEAAHGLLPLDTARGWSALPPPAQAADLAVRRHLDLRTLAGLVVQPVEGEDDSIWSVCPPDERRLRVRVTRQPVPVRPDSCGDEPTAGEQWHASVLDA